MRKRRISILPPDQRYPDHLLIIVSAGMGGHRIMIPRDKADALAIYFQRMAAGQISDTFVYEVEEKKE